MHLRLRQLSHVSWIRKHKTIYGIEGRKRREQARKTREVGKSVVKGREDNFHNRSVILDDMVGTSAFKAQGKSALTNLCLKNRHLSISLCILCQSLKMIPKAIRNNTSLFVIFKFASTRSLLKIYTKRCPL